MAINVDDVYQKVLVLANKEQRGYITPQEYNLLANQAQRLIFEQYFYDLDKALDMFANNTEYADRTTEIQERIVPFENNGTAVASVVTGTAIATLPAGVHKLGTVFRTNVNYKVEKVDANEINLMEQTALYAPTVARSVYVRRSKTTIQLYPITPNIATSSSGIVTFNSINKPSQVIWNYTVVNNQALYNSTTSVNFELHAAEESNLVYKILEMAGIVLNKPGLVQIATNEETAMMAKKQ
tara:strand:- start:155 stop:874 length:720 start_codon:yes stop_codon:yes gene_type:complete